jgi:hypothetical protein
MPRPPARAAPDRSSSRAVPPAAARLRPVVTGEILISPAGIAHLPGCPHKGRDPDYIRWATLNLPRAWERLGNGEQLTAIGVHRPGLAAKSRCRNCITHGP